jgi:hypothetical protein
MNSIIEIHDSRVAGINGSDGTEIVHFSPAYLHKSEGRPAFDPGTGWVQEARLIFSEALVSGDFPDWPCDIMDGEIVVGNEQHDNLIPVPLDVSKRTELRLVFDSDHIVTIAGQAVRLELVGEPRYVEDAPRHKPAA